MHIKDIIDLLSKFKFDLSKIDLSRLTMKDISEMMTDGEEIADHAKLTMRLVKKWADRIEGRK